MVGPRIVIYTIVDFFVRVACTFCAKLPDRPLVAVLVVEEFDEL